MPTGPRPHLVSGLDLGKVADFSALAVLERFTLDKPVAKRRYRFELKWLDTWELGTRYTTDRTGERSIIGDVRALFDTPVLRHTPLAIDQTGVGNAVVDIIRAARVPARITPIVITAGHSITRDPKTGETHVPKKELVSTLLVLLEGGLLKWTSPGQKGALKLAGRLEKELAAFRVEVTRAKNETFGAESSAHDDLVMAVALAAWLGENTGSADPAGIGLPDAGERSVIESAPDGVFASGSRLP